MKLSQFEKKAQGSGWNFLQKKTPEQSGLCSGVAPPMRFERMAFRLGVASIRYSSVPVKRVKPLILLDFTVVTLLVMYGFFLLIFIVFCGRN